MDFWCVMPLVKDDGDGIVLEYLLPVMDLNELGPDVKLTRT